jgi:type VI secretion system secreted protein VgrG
MANEEVHFAWERARHRQGPWRHLRVLELRGEEAMSRPFSFELELVHDGDGAAVVPDDLIGAAAAIKIRTRTRPAFRVIHGIVSAAVELDFSATTHRTRYRVVLRPPHYRAAITRRSAIFVDKSLRAIVEEVLTRSAGMALTPRADAPAPRPRATGELASYGRPRQTFAWALEDARRLDDPTARPYCVQYDESDLAFVSRLLEEEGIAYHLEHGDSECLLVLSDHDGGRRRAVAPVGPDAPAREVFAWREGARLRPRSVALDDYNWERPDMDLRAHGPSGRIEPTDTMVPGRYVESPTHGAILAEKREERFDAERSYAVGEGHCRALAAGLLFRLEHPGRFSGEYLCTVLRHHAVQRPFDGEGTGDESYRVELECLRADRGPRGSRFRPERLVRRPRIYGVQTVVVTADPFEPDATLHVGGPADIGCVRVRFRWDDDEERNAREPSSCWLRVSQLFAGADHGALWHPRVGEEVIVEHLDGDPDRPIVTGRVYNGKNLAPENATRRPTYSVIKSRTVPEDGRYNLISFEDRQGEEEVVVHAARDYTLEVGHDATRGVARHAKDHVRGNQETNVDGWSTLHSDGFLSIDSGTSITATAPFINLNAKSAVDVQAGDRIDARAPVIRANADAILHAKAGAVLVAEAPIVVIKGAAVVRMEGGVVHVHGGQVHVDGGSVDIKGSPIRLN